MFSLMLRTTHEPRREKTGFLHICENKDADQLRGNREADQRLCFRYKDSIIPLLPKSEISSFWPSSVVVQLGLCRTRSEIPKTGFLTTRLTLKRSLVLFSSNDMLVEPHCYKTFNVAYVPFPTALFLLLSLLSLLLLLNGRAK